MEITGTYGVRNKTPATILCYRDRYVTWYCVQGSQNVNATTEELRDGVDIEAVKDVDYFYWDCPIMTVEQLEMAVNA